MSFAIPLLLAACAAGLLTPLVIRASLQLGFVDKPDGKRKQQSSAMPLGGGVVVFIAVLGTLAFSNSVIEFAQEKVAPLPTGILLIAASIILLTGLIDDYVGIRGTHKLAMQTVAALVASLCFGIDRLTFLGVDVELGSLHVAISVLWMLGCINAFNLIDGADGIAATLGAIASFTLGAIAIINGKPEASLLPLALCGALVGFLIFNLPPAKIYLGDSGSMLIGLMVGIVALHASVKSQATFAIGAPLALLAIPIADTSFAIFRRKLTGRSIYDTDRGHLHHCLLSQGATPLQLVAIVAGVATLVSIVTVASIVFQFDVILPLTVLTILFVMLRFRIFGHGEFQLLRSKLNPILTRIRPSDDTHQVVSVHIQGIRDWSNIWEQVTSFSHNKDLKAAQFTLNIPWMHESFHGRWGTSKSFSDRSLWKMRLPIMMNETNIGWLEFCGDQSPNAGAVVPMTTAATVAIELVESLQEQIAQTCDLVPESPVKSRIGQSRWSKVPSA